MMYDQLKKTGTAEHTTMYDYQGEGVNGNQKMYSLAMKRMHVFLYNYNLIWSGGHDRLSCLQNDMACPFA